jgi:phage terminase large subunit GpA-like protein
VSGELLELPELEELDPELSALFTANARRVIEECWALGWARPPKLTVSEWADQHRRLGDASHEKGQWRTDRAPYARGVMDALSADDPHERVVWMKGIQIGASEVGLNWLGYSIQHDPCPFLLVQPNLGLARRFSHRRIATMIRDTPAVRERVYPERARDSRNSTLYREFPGGALIMAGANSAASLGTDPCRKVMFDELDKYKEQIGYQGDPVSLGEGRTTDFPNRKLYYPTTPTTVQESRVLQLYLASNRQRFFIPCPHCGHFDFLTWQGADWITTDKRLHHRIKFNDDNPRTAHMVCSSCKSAVDEGAKNVMLGRGEWRPTHPEGGDPKVAGFHLSGLYSPLGWLSWEKVVEEWFQKKNDPSQLRVWTNERLGECWDERPREMAPHIITSRFEVYPAEVPHGVGILVGSTDVQDHGLICHVTGYGAGEESWKIHRGTLHGDPSQRKVWELLDELRHHFWTHESGQKVGAECWVIDSGGHHHEDVYAYTRHREHEMVFSIRGGNDPTAPLLGPWTRKNAYRAKVFTLGVDSGKDTIYSRLRITTVGPGYMHVPKGREGWTDEVNGEEYANQLTAEVRERKFVRGRGWSRVWKPIRAANHDFDCEVYSLGALKIYAAGVVLDLAERAAKLSLPPNALHDEPPPEDPGSSLGRPGGFVKNW